MKKQTTLFDIVRSQYGLDKNSVFRYYNCNPYHKHTDDCVIRAITAGTGNSWEEVVSDLSKYMLQYGYMMNTPETYGMYLKDKGWVKQQAPKKNKSAHMTVGEFVRKFKGHAIVHVDDNHMTYIADGKIWDLWDPSSHIIGEYWVPASELRNKKRGV
jgi:hypothetical protein